MTTYVALLRGIMPMNPNMRSEKLKQVFESLGFKNVHTVIASGNVVFQSPTQKNITLETQIEKALFAQLGFNSTTIIRTQKEIESLIQKDPFGGKAHTSKDYLIITFLKHISDSEKKKGNGEIATVIDLTTGKTPDFMRGAEKKFGKDITTRTWKTVGRIHAKMVAQLSF